MLETFTFRGDTLDGRLRGYDTFVRREFYDGDLETEARKDFFLTAEKAISHPISLIRMVSNSSISYRREWRHIRENKTRLRVVWFVRQGTVQLVRSRNSYKIRAGEWGIIDSGVPFHAKASTDGDKFDVLYAVIPAHLCVSHLAVTMKLDRPVPISSSNRTTTSRLLDYLLTFGNELSPAVANQLTDAFLQSLADRVRDTVECKPAKDMIRNQRITQITDFILERISDVNIRHVDVARRFGISSRYLYCLLSTENTTFSRILWDARVRRASEMLGDKKFRNRAIHEIAYLVGFKSVSHFSRNFKASFGISPREFRSRRARIGES